MALANRISEEILKAGGKSYYVGGYVRDQLLGLESKDIDMEVFGIETEVLESILSNFGKIKFEGKSYGVYKIGDIDISIPRRERKIGVGHTGFEIESDPHMSIKEAAERRDFTINSIYRDTYTGAYHDPYNGLKHIEECYLIPTSDRFKEDPLRVMRGFQFSARFGFALGYDFDHYAKAVLEEFDSIPKERLWAEFHKWATKGVDMMQSFEAFIDCGWIYKFPEISNMIGVKQDPIWHPEGECAIHTFHVVQAASEIAVRDELCPNDRLILVLAALCHDMGKPSTTELKNGRWVAPNHANVGISISKSFLESIKAPNWVIDQVCELVKYHMFRTEVVTPRVVRRKMTRLKHTTIDMLLRLIEADISGRPPLPKGKNRFILDVEKQVDVIINEPESIKPLIVGADIFKYGIIEGVELGAIKKKMFDLQIDEGYERGHLLNILHDMLS